MNHGKSGKDLPPKCEYCTHCIPTQQADTALCRFRGVTAPDGACKKFDYDPLKRVPRRPAPLPAFSEEEFKL